MRSIWLPASKTPAPWANVMANANFGTLVTESGLGFTWRGNSQTNRLTPWHNDPVTDPQSEVDLPARQRQRRVLDAHAAAHSRE